MKKIVVVVSLSLSWPGRVPTHPGLATHPVPTHPGLATHPVRPTRARDPPRATHPGQPGFLKSRSCARDSSRARNTRARAISWGAGKTRYTPGAIFFRIQVRFLEHSCHFWAGVNSGKIWEIRLASPPGPPGTLPQDPPAPPKPPLTLIRMCGGYGIYIYIYYI